MRYACLLLVSGMGKPNTNPAHSRMLTDAANFMGGLSEPTSFAEADDGSHIRFARPVRGAGAGDEMA